MSDATQDDGAGVNLIWTSINGEHQALGYRQGGVNTPLAVLSGPATASASKNPTLNPTLAIDVESGHYSGREGDGLTYGLTGGVDQAWFSIASSGAVVSKTVYSQYWDRNGGG